MLRPLHQSHSSNLLESGPGPEAEELALAGRQEESLADEARHKIITSFLKAPYYPSHAAKYLKLIELTDEIANKAES